jgi:hypothetical protein
VLRLDRSQRTLRRLETRKLQLAGLLERSDLQRMIVTAPGAFCAEIAEELLFLGEEVTPTDVVSDRIDILAMDRQGAVVVVELKRGANKLQLLQALSYAAMISEWETEGIVSRLATFRVCSEEDAEEEIQRFLDEDISVLNERQRIILIAEDYDYQVLATAKWLAEKYEVDIACWKVELAEDSGAEYLSFGCVYPPPEIASVARTRRPPPGQRTLTWPDWDAALAGVNPVVANFFHQRLAENWPNNLARRLLHFRVGGRNRFSIAAGTEHAYLLQRGRFDGDVSFWAERFGLDAPIAQGRELRIFLQKEAQFDAFMKSLREEIPGRTFTYDPPASDADETAGEQTAHSP